MTTPPPIPRRKSRKGFWIAVISLTAVAGLGFSIVIGLVVGRSMRTAGHGRGGVDEYPQLLERWSYGEGSTKAVRIAVSGVIMRQSKGGLFGPRIDKIQEIIHQIRAATHDEQVRAILLEIDSPGGAITPTDEIYHELRVFRESRSDRIIVAFTRDLAASGGYYAAMASDWIIAQPTSVVGSIGVIMQSLNWKQLTDDIGIRDVTIKSGPNKDLLNPFQDPKPHQLELMQEVIDDMHERFRGIVQSSRRLEPEQMEDIADGRIFTAEQALDLSLIDQIGYWTDAADRVTELLGADSVRFVQYYRHQDFLTMLTQAKAPWGRATLMEWQNPEMMYLWRP